MQENNPLHDHKEIEQRYITFHQSNEASAEEMQSHIFVNQIEAPIKSGDINIVTEQQASILLQEGDLVTIETDIGLHNTGISLPDRLVAVQTAASLLRPSDTESSAIVEETILNHFNDEIHLQYTSGTNNSQNCFDETEIEVFPVNPVNYCSQNITDAGSYEIETDTIDKLDTEEPAVTENESIKLFTDFVNVKTVDKTFNSNPWNCPYRPCQELFATEANLSRHILLNHIKQVFRCQYCCKLFPSESDHEIHVEGHVDRKFANELGMMIPEAEINVCQPIPAAVTFLNIFYCNSCNERFELHDDLVRHRAFHEKIFKCAKCEKSYGCREALSIHQYTHCNVKPLSCSKCNKHFRLSAHLVEHEQQHMGDNPFKCHYCDKVYHSHGPLRVHVFYSHFDYINDCLYYKCPSTGQQLFLTRRDAERYKCPQCLKPFANKVYQKRHNLNRCRRVNQFPCAKCPRKFPSTVQRDEHESSGNCIASADNVSNPHESQCSDVKGDDFSNLFTFTEKIEDKSTSPTSSSLIASGQISSYKCHGCGNCFASQNALSMHGECGYSSLLRCNVCRRKFDNTNEFSEHKMVCENGNNTFKCTHCEKIFVSRLLLKSHVFYHHFDGHSDCLYYKCPITAKENFLTRHDALKNSCDVCGNPFLKRAEMLKHKRNVHLDNPKPFQCEKCESRFTTSGQLKVHSYIHYAVRQFTCSICNTGCTTRSALASHMVIHSDKKPYQCTFCGKTFARSIQVKRHTLTHTGERNHQCGVCGKLFPTVTDVKKHSVIHNASRVRPYNCQYCDKTYYKKSDLNTHRQTHFRD